MTTEPRDELVGRLRATTERMGCECNVPDFDLWNDHSNACLQAADLIERYRKSDVAATKAFVTADHARLKAEARVRELEAQLAEAREQRRRWHEASVADRAARHEAERALAEEREACAQVAETHSFARDIDWWMHATKKDVSAEACMSVAAAIRARSKT